MLLTKATVGVEGLTSFSKNAESCLFCGDKMPKGKKGFQKGHKLFSTNGCFKKGLIPWNKGKDFLVGNKNPKWDGGENLGSGGYVRVYSPKHPYAINNYVRKHRLIIEKKIGRYLTIKEVGHHINGVKTDNRIENLMAFVNNGVHKRFEKGGIVKSKEIIFNGSQLRKEK